LKFSCKELHLRESKSLFGDFYETGYIIRTYMVLVQSQEAI